MLETKEFGQELKKRGFDFYSGVPCSFLKDLINYAINDCHYVGAANEGDAVAIATGAYLGGKKPVVLMQNSGLTNAVSPLSSLIYTFKIPVLGFVSLRGEPGLTDEPQHELMGTITTNMLDLLKVKWQYLSPEPNIAIKQIIEANKWINQSQTFFFIVKKGTFEPLMWEKEDRPIQKHLRLTEKKFIDEQPSRFQVLQVINQYKGNQTAQLATTGKTGRELYEVEDAKNNLYMVGSMGCISSIGLGLALSRQEKDVVVIDGDGSLLMRLGSLATNGSYQPKNMLHILLDNESHDSTGGQQTVSSNVNFVQIASSCGYENALYVHGLEELQENIKKWKQTKGLTFLYMKVAKGSKKNLGRPKVSPPEVKDRFRKFIN